jgi:hypothetical protein
MNKYNVKDFIYDVLIHRAESAENNIASKFTA